MTQPNVTSAGTGEVSADGPHELTTGTTTVGIRTADAVVLAADRRASLGGRFVSAKDATKVEQVHPSGAVTIAGSVGGAQSFIRSLRSEASLYESRRGEPMSATALTTMAANLVKSNPGFRTSPLVGVVDDDGPALFELDQAGGLMEKAYGSVGSGMQVAYGTLEGGFAEDLSVEAARELATDAVAAASERDTASGNGVTVAVVTAEGVDFVEGED